jgi:hypothetical protein
MRLAARAEWGRAARTAALALLASACLLFDGPRALAQSQKASDPLPSWNDGAAKRAIIDFVGRVTRTQSAEFVPLGDRIATFDNDGTLWQEKPVAEGVFAIARLREVAAGDPSLRQRQPFKAALEGDVAYLREAGVAAVLELLRVAYAGMTQERFAGEARAFLDTARHPTLNRRYTELAYPPMLELLAYLRANGFRTWLCSGGTTDFMRIFSQDVYGVPPEQVIGSALKRETRFEGPRLVIWRLPEIETLNDEHVKPVNIDRQIGIRPLVAAGNVRTGGDVAHLEYSRGRAGPSLQLLIDHDDDIREFAYQERDSVSLKAARAYGFVVVSMRRDWKTVFAPPGTVARQRRVP